MTDDELVQAFEAGTLPADRFSHAAHVRVAWYYLRQAPLPQALARFADALQRFAAALGASAKYHETITVGYMLVIADRVSRQPDLSWDDFAAANPDLLCSKPSALAGWYSEALLASDRARRGFVLPDRMPVEVARTS